MNPLTRIPPSWRPHLIDLDRALAPVTHNPNRYDRAVTRWAATEPTLHGLRATTAFAEPRGCLTEPQARAMIRTARTDDPDAEIAGWSLIWQFTLAIISWARQEQRLPGSDGPRAAVCTATAELWRLIHHINLDTNTASIFYALASKARRAVIPCTHHLTPADRLARSVRESETIERAQLARSSSPTDAAYDAVEWRSMTRYLTDVITDDVIEQHNWNRDTRHFHQRKQRLRSLIASRLADARTGQERTVSSIATDLGEPAAALKVIQTDLSRTMHHSAQRYQAILTGADDLCATYGSGWQSQPPR